MPQPDALEAFIAAVESGMHDDAIARFYTDDASMQDDLGPLRKGKDTLIARERQFMTRFREIRSKCVGRPRCHPVEF